MPPQNKFIFESGRVLFNAHKKNININTNLKKKNERITQMLKICNHGFVYFKKEENERIELKKKVLIPILSSIQSCSSYSFIRACTLYSTICVRLLFAMAHGLCTHHNKNLLCVRARFGYGTQYAYCSYHLTGSK